jgi:adenine-specific DNA-methyltransferase
MRVKTVFIGGSRHVHLLDDAVRRRLDRIIKQGLAVVVGDADGADKEVQTYLHQRGYPRVEVFCMDGRCRNNIGHWPIRAVGSRCRHKNLFYYAQKDCLMAQEADMGLMIWEGRSAGTLANVGRLVRLGKVVVLHLAATGQAVRLACEADWQRLLGTCAGSARARVEDELRAEADLSANRSEPSLF